jgi:hypothetical protein
VGLVLPDSLAGFYAGVVVNSVSPTYYAPGIPFGDIVLRGLNFDLIPDTAVGVMSNKNEDPLYLRDTTDVSYLYNISQRSENEITMTTRAPYAHQLPFYLGAILSADRSTVYWMNESRPLP